MRVKGERERRKGRKEKRKKKKREIERREVNDLELKGGKGREWREELKE